MTAHSGDAGGRRGKQLLRASTVFAKESRLRSWWCLFSTLAVFVALLAAASLPISWFARIPFSFIAGLVLVRMFVIYHDYQHGAILRDSRIAGSVMWAYGLLALTPPSIWRRTHNHHHKHNAQLRGADIGSYPLMTTDDYAKTGRLDRWIYGIARHPLTMLCGYATVFGWGMCVRPFLSRPRVHLDGAVALLLHFGLFAYLAVQAPDVLLTLIVIPCTVGSAVGAYLFYAQHNFPGVTIRPRADWDYVTAAMHSSSHITMGPLMNWFTGNIGYHHVHHLNPHIPFYRLPEAMAGLPELQSPTTTSLSPIAIYRCLKLKLWSPALNRLTGYAEAMEPQPSQATAVGD